MASPSVTYTFANSTTADATQVNQNFTDIISGLTDGTKDLSISALTVAGTATLNGNVSIGNSSSDTLTITAVLSSSLAMGTTFAYDFGSATVGVKSVYLGSNDSAAKSVRLIAGAVTTSYTATLPVATASQTGMTLISDTSSVWSYRYTEKTTAKTTTYTATGDETVITCATSSGWTLTLPAAASFTGKHFHIKKTSSDLNLLTIDGNASETIDGVLTIQIGKQYDSVKIVSDGSNWHIVANNITIAASYYSSANNNISTTQSGNYDTKVYDTLSSVTAAAAGTGTWKFTAPVAGTYSIQVNVFFTTVSAPNVHVYKNGSDFATMAGIFAGGNGIAAYVIALAATDYIDIRTTSALTQAGGAITASPANIQIVRVGN